ncbi:hypothetical protein [Stygiolobus caldivivus]|uniref:Uncharacterized protein n=1 Tax=Stygiolobus caldivivus TaxID=2824673 RepID=A0A8D5U679_9CREN|nr:hypothetical protein [Stygiolobus caldivivus]BCU70271.1 hypothetical protein KN1_15680 [Stygiolobus caldivivus]
MNRKNLSIVLLLVTLEVLSSLTVFASSQENVSRSSPNLLGMFTYGSNFTLYIENMSKSSTSFTFYQGTIKHSFVIPSTHVQILHFSARDGCLILYYVKLSRFSHQLRHLVPNLYIVAINLYTWSMKDLNVSNISNFHFLYYSPADNCLVGYSLNFPPYPFFGEVILYRSFSIYVLKINLATDHVDKVLLYHGCTLPNEQIIYQGGNVTLISSIQNSFSSAQFPLISPPLTCVKFSNEFIDVVTEVSGNGLGESYTQETASCLSPIMYQVVGEAKKVNSSFALLEALRLKPTPIVQGEFNDTIIQLSNNGQLRNNTFVLSSPFTVYNDSLYSLNYSSSSNTLTVLRYNDGKLETVFNLTLRSNISPLFLTLNKDVIEIVTLEGLPVLKSPVYLNMTSASVTNYINYPYSLSTVGVINYSIYSLTGRLLYSKEFMASIAIFFTLINYAGNIENPHGILSVPLFYENLSTNKFLNVTFSVAVFSINLTLPYVITYYNGSLLLLDQQNFYEVSEDNITSLRSDIVYIIGQEYLVLVNGTKLTLYEFYPQGLKELAYLTDVSASFTNLDFYGYRYSSLNISQITSIISTLNTDIEGSINSRAMNQASINSPASNCDPTHGSGFLLSSLAPSLKVYSTTPMIIFYEKGASSREEDLTLIVPPDGIFSLNGSYIPVGIFGKNLYLYNHGYFLYINTYSQTDTITLEGLTVADGSPVMELVIVSLLLAVITAIVEIKNKTLRSE